MVSECDASPSHSVDEAEESEIIAEHLKIEIVDEADDFKDPDYPIHTVFTSDDEIETKPTLEGKTQETLTVKRSAKKKATKNAASGSRKFQ